MLKIKKTMQLHDTKCKKNGKIIYSPRFTFKASNKTLSDKEIKCLSKVHS